MDTVPKTIKEFADQFAESLLTFAYERFGFNNSLLPTACCELLCALQSATTQMNLELEPTNKTPDFEARMVVWKNQKFKGTLTVEQLDRVAFEVTMDVIAEELGANEELSETDDEDWEVN